MEARPSYAGPSKDDTPFGKLSRDVRGGNEREVAGAGLGHSSSPASSSGRSQTRIAWQMLTGALKSEPSSSKRSTPHLHERPCVRLVPGLRDQLLPVAEVQESAGAERGPV